MSSCLTSAFVFHTVMAAVVQVDYAGRIIDVDTHHDASAAREKSELSNQEAIFHYLAHFRVFSPVKDNGDPSWINPLNIARSAGDPDIRRWIKDTKHGQVFPGATVRELVQQPGVPFPFQIQVKGITDQGSNMDLAAGQFANVFGIWIPKDTILQSSLSHGRNGWNDFPFAWDMPLIEVGDEAKLRQILKGAECWRVQCVHYLTNKDKLPFAFELTNKEQISFSTPNSPTTPTSELPVKTKIMAFRGNHRVSFRAVPRMHTGRAPPPANFSALSPDSVYVTWSNWKEVYERPRL